MCVTSCIEYGTFIYSVFQHYSYILHIFTAQSTSTTKSKTKEKEKDKPKDKDKTKVRHVHPCHTSKQLS